MRVSFLFCLNMMEGNKYDGLWNEFLCYALLFYTKQFWAIFFQIIEELNNSEMVVWSSDIS